MGLRVVNRLYDWFLMILNPAADAQSSVSDGVSGEIERAKLKC
jgi:hypothetical protein